MENFLQPSDEFLSIGKSVLYAKKLPPLTLKLTPRPASAPIDRPGTSSVPYMTNSAKFDSYSLVPLSRSNTTNSSSDQSRQSLKQFDKSDKKTSIFKRKVCKTTPLYYFSGTNGLALVDDYLSSLGWRRTSDKSSDGVKLNWCEVKTSLNNTIINDHHLMYFQVPNSHLLTNKTHLLTSLKEHEKIMTRMKTNVRMSYRYFFRESYRLDVAQEREAFFRKYQIGDLWISSPISSKKSKGDFFIAEKEHVDKLKKLSEEAQGKSKEKSYKISPELRFDRLVQRYVRNPLLINGKSLVVRCFMLIVCTNPLVMLYHDGYCKLYSTKSIENFKPPDLFSHKYTTWSLDDLNEYVNQQFSNNPVCRVNVSQNWVNTTLKRRCQDIIYHCFKSVKSRLIEKLGYFDLIACDFLLNNNFSVTLMEMRSNPDLKTSCVVLKRVIPPLVHQLLGLSIECFNKALKKQKILPFLTDNDCVLLHNDDFHERIKVDTVRSLKNVSSSIKTITKSTSDGSNICASNKGPFFYTGGGNGSKLVENYLSSLGWTKVVDREFKNYDLKWCMAKDAVNYFMFREREQMLFQIPNSYLLTTKTGLLMSLRSYDRIMKRLQTYNSNKIMNYNNFFPESYCLDVKNDCLDFFRKYKADELWISKPSNMSQGKGIYIIRDQEEVEKIKEKTKLVKVEDNGSELPTYWVRIPRLVQRYITNPLLINGKKFDLRNYMLIACTNPFVVLYRDGYCRLSCNDYDIDSTDLASHLTNQSVQKKSHLYEELKEDTVWSMDRFNIYVNKNYPDMERNWVHKVLRKKCQEIILHCFNSVRNRLGSKLGYFDLIGCDFLISDDFSVSLLEMTSGPALHTNCKVLKDVIPSLVNEFLGISLECFEKAKSNEKMLPLKSKSECVLLYNNDFYEKRGK